MASRHPTRKKLSAHERGEHRGYNVKFAHAGCPSCQTDVAEVNRRQDEIIEAAREYIDTRAVDVPIRQQSAEGVPEPSTSIERRCVRCGASFLGLAPGRTGERGLWNEWHWFCSQECFDQPNERAIR